MLGIRRIDNNRKRGQQCGFTLVEVIVAMAVTAVIGGAIVGAFAATTRTLTPGGSKDRLSGAHDLSFLEQNLSRDAARSSCITAPDMTSGTYQAYGQTASTCLASTGYGGYGNPALIRCTSAPFAALCFGWPQLGTAVNNYADSTCHIAMYTSSVTPSGSATPPPSGNVFVTRTEYVVPMQSTGNPTTHTTVIVNHFDTIKSTSFTPWVQGAAPPGYKAPGELPPSYNWLRTLQVTIRSTGVAGNQPVETLILHPIAVDPDGLGAAIEPTGGPPSAC